MEDIKDRLNHILRSKNLTAKQFAELMEIQPSNVSHLLNGRNKPSLDFLIKLKEVFPEYSFDWIIMGKKPITINEPNPVISETQNIVFEDDNKAEDIIFEDFDGSSNESGQEDIRINDEIKEESSKIDKIFVIYSDKTFEILKPHI